MSNHRWDSDFMELFERCLQRYREGDCDYRGYYTEGDGEFLSRIGCKPREFFDFVEDCGDHGDPSPTTALLVASVRRDYFLWMMDGQPGRREVRPDDLPDRGDELGGITWLPRIIVKARAKLRGELNPDIMYCCGGDRAFLRSHDIAPADFLRAVWSAGEDDGKILEFVRKHLGT